MQNTRHVWLPWLSSSWITKAPMLLTGTPGPLWTKGRITPKLRVQQVSVLPPLFPLVAELSSDSQTTVQQECFPPDLAYVTLPLIIFQTGTGVAICDFVSTNTNRLSFRSAWTLNSNLSLSGSCRQRHPGGKWHQHLLWPHDLQGQCCGDYTRVGWFHVITDAHNTSFALLCFIYSWLLMAPHVLKLWARWKLLWITTSSEVCKLIY